MSSGNIVKYYKELQPIADHLNKILFSHKDYLKDSFAFICGLKGDKLVIDVIEIEHSLPIQQQVFILGLMTTITDSNHETIEIAFKEITSSKSFPRTLTSSAT